MGVTLPVVCLTLLLLFIKSNCKETGRWRDSFLSALIIITLLLLLATEVLSLFTALSYWPLLSAWSIIGLTLLAFVVRAGKKISTPILPGLTRTEISMIVVMALVFSAVLLAAILAPPNSWDAMTYHMARVAHWEQNGSVALYPSHVIRQLFMPPLAEYQILHLQILAGSDHYANLVQFFAMVTGAIAVSSIAKLLGGDRRTQILASLIAVTVPTGILTASGAKNDYVVATWIVIFVHAGIKWQKETTLKNGIWAGAALGLALLSKGTAYVYVLPFLLWFGWSGFKKERSGVLRTILVVAAVAIAINGPFYARNMEVFGHPLGTMSEELPSLKPTNDMRTATAFVSNLARNVSLHLATASAPLNTNLQTFMEWLHEDILEIGISDPATTWLIPFFIGSHDIFIQHEAATGAPLHFVLACLLCVTAFFAQRKGSALLSYILCLFVAFALLSFIFKWTPYNVRYHLPLFILLAPFMAMVIGRTGSALFITRILAAILFFQTMPPALMNVNRPLLPLKGPLLELGRKMKPPDVLAGYNAMNLFRAKRRDLYFAAQPAKRGAYLKTVRYLNSVKCRKVGLITDLDNDPSGQAAMEYQLWALLKESGGRSPFRIEHVNVVNESGVKSEERPFAQFDPCAVIKLYEPGSAYGSGKVVKPSTGPLEFNGGMYLKAVGYRFVSIYARDYER